MQNWIRYSAFPFPGTNYLQEICFLRLEISYKVGGGGESSMIEKIQAKFEKKRPFRKRLSKSLPKFRTDLWKNQPSSGLGDKNLPFSERYDRSQKPRKVASLTLVLWPRFELYTLFYCTENAHKTGYFYTPSLCLSLSLSVVVVKSSRADQSGNGWRNDVKLTQRVLHST